MERMKNKRFMTEEELNVLKKYTYDKEKFCNELICEHALQRIKERNITTSLVTEVVGSKNYEIVEFRYFRKCVDGILKTDYRVLIKSRKEFFINGKWNKLCLSISLVTNYLITAYWNYRGQSHKQSANSIKNIVEVLENGKKQQII